MIHMNALSGAGSVSIRDAPEIEMHGAGDVPGGEILRRTQIDDERLRVPLDGLIESSGRREQLSVGKTGHGRIL